MESVYSYVYAFGSTVLLRLSIYIFLYLTQQTSVLNSHGFFPMKMSNIDDLSVSSLMDLSLPKECSNVNIQG